MEPLRAANTLTLGGYGQSAGSWGGTNSGATYINPTYFLTIGKLNVGSNSCTAGTWLGGTSNNWAIASNWCGGAVPDAATNVVIPAGGNQPTISTGTSALCNNITINTGAALTISGSPSLTVSGNWTNNGTYTSASESVTFNGTDQTISSATAATFNNLTLSGTGTITSSAAITANGVLTVSNCNLEMGANLLTLRSNFVNTGGSVSGSGGVTITGNATQSIGSFTNTGTVSMTKIRQHSYLDRKCDRRRTDNKRYRR